MEANFFSLIKSSIFDDFTENVNTQEETKENKNSTTIWITQDKYKVLDYPEISNEIILESTLLQSEKHSTEMKERYFELYHDKLVCYENDSKTQIRGILPLFGLKMEYIEDIKDENDNVIFFLFFTKNKQYDILICDEQSKFEQWVNHLRPLIILTNFSNFYTFKNVLGKGTFAKVLLCQRINDKKQFAVKIFDKKLINNSKDPHKTIVYSFLFCFQICFSSLDYEMKSIFQEIQTIPIFQNFMKFINRFSIQVYYQVFEGQQHLYLILSHYTGGELLKKLSNDEQYSEQQASVLMHKILSALGYLNEKQIMHRDLKPENIILRNELDCTDVVIVDFGLSEYQYQQPLLFRRCGTPGYVAPEILADEEQTTQVDIFSAGVLLYIILTGYAVFFGENYIEILNKNKKCLIDFDFAKFGVKLSAEAQDLIIKMLKRDPKERITVHEALIHPWFGSQIKATENIHISQFLLKQLYFYEQIIQRQQILKETKPKELTDSQNIICNSPLLPQKDLSIDTQKKDDFVSPAISPNTESQKKSQFNAFNAKKKDDIKKNVDSEKYKEKIFNPSKKHLTLKAISKKKKE